MTSWPEVFPPPLSALLPEKVQFAIDADEVAMQYTPPPIFVALLPVKEQPLIAISTAL
jgi:hypothetical protein